MSNDIHSCSVVSYVIIIEYFSSSKGLELLGVCIMETVLYTVYCTGILP